MNAEPDKTKPIDEDAQYLIDQLYSVAPLKVRMPGGSEQDVGPDGNIGLLSYGYMGIVSWRKKREEVYGTRFYSPLLETMKKEFQKRKEAKNGK